MAFNPIETDYRPNFGLGAYYQGINAANAKQLTEEDILKAFLANQKEQNEQPLDLMVKQWQAAHAQDQRAALATARCCRDSRRVQATLGSYPSPGRIPSRAGSAPAFQC